MSNWRYTFKPARFFIIDARAAYLVLLWLFYMKIWTFVLLVLVFLILFFIEQRGYSFPSAVRVIRSYFAGRKRSNTPVFKQRFPVDYQRHGK